MSKMAPYEVPMTMAEASRITDEVSEDGLCAANVERRCLSVLG